MLALNAEEIIQHFPDVLKHAEEEKWTGILDINNGSEQFGTVFLHKGLIAWATSKDQSKNLGFFLEKIGMIPKQRQKEIFNSIKSLGKNGDFGAMIEETGLISRTKLRECLRGHIHAAISSVMNKYDITVKQRECSISATPDLVFFVDEIMQTDDDEIEPPEDSYSNCPAELVYTARIEKKNILESLASLAGYQYSFICNSEAKVLAAHKSKSLQWDMDEILSSSTAWIIYSAEKLREMRIGRMESVLVEHDKGSLIARCLTDENDLFIAASFDENGKPGVIKHKISEMASFVQPGVE